MKRNELPCCIIEDLLPNYIEHLTSELSRKEIDEHLRGCKNCREKLSQLQSPLYAEKQADAAATAFLSKTQKKTRQKVLCSVGCTLLFCIIAAYVLVFHQFAFHFSVKNLYQLSDGGIYFELQTDGAESGISAVSFHDRFDHEREKYSIHMGYSLYSLLQAQRSEATQRKIYAFTISAEDAGRIASGGQLIYQQGGVTLVIWDGKSALEDAPADIEEIAASVHSPFSSYTE